MGDFRLWRAAFAAACLLAALPQGPALAMPLQPSVLGNATPSLVLEAAGPRFHHGKRVKSAYCLRRNYWWFYRPYTTEQEDFPRCEPYFHYLEPPYAQRGARSDRYVK